MDPPPQRQTKVNKQLDAVLTFYDLTAWILDEYYVLEEFQSIFNDDGSTM
jgi:hypothetical protein